MITVMTCMIEDHNGWLVALALSLCLAGAYCVSRMFIRAQFTSGLRSYGWYVLTAMTAGAVVWCTHFVAMVGFDPGVPIAFDPLLTFVSLVLAIIGVTPGFVLAGKGAGRLAPLLGGAIVGLVIAAMHFVGMLAYQVRGLVLWNGSHLFASVLLSVALGAVALLLNVEGIRSRLSLNLAPPVFALAIVGLHFTGMSALKIIPAMVDGHFATPAAFQAMAVVVAAGIGITMIGLGLGSYLIDRGGLEDSDLQLKKGTLIDGLTGIGNRQKFNEALAEAIEHARSHRSEIALISIDINRFRDINDRWGHAVGDGVLCQIADRIEAVLADGEMVSRIDGDEFAVICPMEEGMDLAGFLIRLEQAIVAAIHHEIFEIYVTVSMGVAIYPDDARSATHLVGNSQLALRRAATDLVTKVQFYDATMDDSVRQRRALAVDLRRALEHEELQLHYQVQHSLLSGELTGLEALLRWIHPERGFVPPLEFIPIAEETGLILPIGEWVLRKAVQDAVRWKNNCKVAVNLSPYQLVYSDVPALVAEILQETGLSPDRLELELTETALFEDGARALQTLTALRDMGVQIALDDFGTGYSSLVTLRSYPFDKIKLDRSLVDGVESSVQADAMVRAVLSLGKSLGMTVLAEGVETEEQLNLLAMEGCDEAQGYFLGRPKPQSQLVAKGILTLHDRLPPKPPVTPSIARVRAAA